MKQKITRAIVSVFSILMIFFSSMALAPPVHAIDLSIGDLFNSIFALGTASVDIINSTYNSVAYIGAQNAQRDYYRTLTAQAQREMALGHYSSGGTSRYSIINNDNRTINYTTNNQYVSKTYNDITYNATYNSYYTKIDNHHYFITYAPTYTNITYIGETQTWDQRQSYDYYFELPDGRNSFYLTADDIKGMVFNYDVTNFDSVAEDEGTLGLYHFDGDIYDSSYNGGSAEWVKGASTTYMQASGYNAALYMGGSDHELKFNLPRTIGQGDYTLEYRLYLAPVQNYAMTFSCASNPLVYHYYFDNAPQPGGGMRTTTWWYFWGSNPGETQPQYHVVRGASCDLNVQYSKDNVTASSGFRYVYINGRLVEVGNSNQSLYTPADTQFDTAQNVIDLYSDIVFGIYSGDANILPFLYHNETSPFTLNAYGTAPQVLANLNLSCSCGEDVGANDVVRLFSKTLNGSTLGVASNLDNLNDTFTVAAVGEWVTYSVVRKSGVTSYYVNGSRIGSSSESVSIGNSLSIKIPAGYLQYCYLDEVRISSRALYSGSYYTPASAPFDTNKVLVLPNVASRDNKAIAIQSSIPVHNSRIGGVRPTYPVKGDVFIALGENKKVTDIQIFDGADWKHVGGAIKKDGVWVALMGFDFSGDILIPVDDDSGGGESGGDDSGGGGGSTSTDILGKLGKIFSGIGVFVGGLLDNLKTFVDGAIERVTALTTYGERFGGFLAAAVPFIPNELIVVIIAGIAIAIVIRVIRLFFK